MSDDKRKFKISGITLETGTGTTKKSVKISDFETEELEFGDDKKKQFEVNRKETIDGTEYDIKIKFEGEKGLYYDGGTVKDVTSNNTALAFTVKDKGSAVGASWHKGMTFGTLVILAVAVIGVIWYFMFSKNEEEEKEEEGL